MSFADAMANGFSSAGSPTREPARSEPSPPERHLREGFGPVAVVAGDDEGAGTFCEWRHDLAGEAAVGHALEDAAERGAEPLRVIREELRVGLA